MGSLYADVFLRRMDSLRVSLAGRDARVLLVVATRDVISQLTAGTLELQAGQAGSARMEVFCSRCRCGSCWTPASW